MGDVLGGSALESPGMMMMSRSDPNQLFIRLAHSQLSSGKLLEHCGPSGTSILSLSQPHQASAADGGDGGEGGPMHFAISSDLSRRFVFSIMLSEC